MNEYDSVQEREREREADVIRTSLDETGTREDRYKTVRGHSKSPSHILCAYSHRVYRILIAEGVRKPPCRIHLGTLYLAQQSSVG